jgi:hypothetical protein
MTRALLRGFVHQATSKVSDSEIGLSSGGAKMQKS